MKKTIVAALAVLAVSAPAAQASHVRAGCRGDGFRQDVLTGNSHEGWAAGFVVGAVGEQVSVVCEVRVDGTLATYTPTALGTTTAVTTGRLTFAADATSRVELCGTVTHSHGTYTWCQPLSLV